MKKKCVLSAKLSSADAQHLHPGRHAHQYHQHLPILVTNKNREWVPNKLLQELHIPMQSPSDEEADREVAAICRAPEYYRVRSHVRCRHQYFMYNMLDDIGEIIHHKRPHKKSPSVQGPPVEH